MSMTLKKILEKIKLRFAIDDDEEKEMFLTLDDLVAKAEPMKPIVSNDKSLV
ncbi:MAG: hypothetical protein M0R51_18230 [Clostridia bacterium]|jgi:hypothetical protein|nr:hypothetical protein [Clostridia bacterium]